MKILEIIIMIMTYGFTLFSIVGIGYLSFILIKERRKSKSDKQRY